MHGDRTCDEVVESGASGFCECRHPDRPVRVRKVSCQHRSFTCRDACRDWQRHECVGWRQTGGCSADGPREPGLDSWCGAVVDGDASGYCECGGGRRIKKAGCIGKDSPDFEPFTCAAECEREEDLYETLDVPQTATRQDIKRAFRRLSLKLHPDKQQHRGRRRRGNSAAAAAAAAAGATPEEEAEEAARRFAEVRSAFEILGDGDLRALYDDGGIKLVVEAREKAARTANRRQKGAGELPKGRGARADMSIGLERLYLGGPVSFKLTRRVLCKGCNHKTNPAAASSTRCSKCKRCPDVLVTEPTRVGMLVYNRQRKARSDERCRDDKLEHTVTIEQGYADGAEITLERMGGYEPAMVPGDVVLRVKQAPHAYFQRDGDDLKTDLNITLKEALVGFRRTIKHLDGRDVVVAREPRTIQQDQQDQQDQQRQQQRQQPAVISSHLEVIEVPGEGMPVHNFASQKGNLRVTLHVAMPARLEQGHVEWLRDNLPDA